MPDLKALVLAAGKSTRIAPVSGGLPKPLIKIQGETVLGRNLWWLSRQGITQVWINLHYQPDEIRAVVGDGSQVGLTVHYEYEPTILGTAGAVRNLSSEWTETFLVVYGDSLLSFDLLDFLKFHQEHRAAVSVALFDCERHPHTGIAGGRVGLAEDGRIQEFCEGSSDPLLPMVNVGVYLLEPEIVGEIPLGRFYDFGRDLFPFLLKRGRRIFGYLITGYCLGIDTPESYQKAIRLIETGEVTLP